MEYYLIVDGKYFVGETMEEIGGYSKSVSGFFQMGNGGQLTKYEFSADREKASSMILYNAIGYMDGIYERVRYLPNSKKPKKITIVAVDEEETVCHCNVKENAELIAKILDCDVQNQIADIGNMV
jgi:hypothetical protein